MGSDLIQPFGQDRVDLPLEFFCETIEVQSQYIRERAKRGTLQALARSTSRPNKEATVIKSASMGRGIKGDDKKQPTRFGANSLLPKKKSREVPSARHSSMH